MAHELLPASRKLGEGGSPMIDAIRARNIEIAKLQGDRSELERQLTEAMTVNYMTGQNAFKSRAVERLEVAGMLEAAKLVLALGVEKLR